MKKYKKIYLEITNVCNLTCKFCPITNRSKEFMEISTFTKILDEIKPYTDYIYLHIKGEPLLHPNIDELLNIAYSKGFKVNITTNGTLINKVNDILFNKQALRQINISLHSLTGNDFKNKNDYLMNIIKFSKEIAKQGVYVSLRLWNLNSHNYNQLNSEIFKTLEKEFNLPYDLNEKIFPHRGITLAENIFLDQDQEFQWPSLAADNIGEVGFCYGLRTHLGILVDGTVVPCCLDGDGIINLGNILTSSLKKIINSKRATDIYNGFSQKLAVEELCKRCGYRTKIDKLKG